MAQRAAAKRQVGAVSRPRRQRSDNPGLSIVIPCYNEAPNIPFLHERVAAACADLDYELIFVNDGSADGTADAVKSLQKGNPRVHLISFVKNFGAQAASRAGLRFARGKFIVTMDADLQHPPEIIPSMVRKAAEGFDIVLMARDRTHFGLLKSLFSRLFYSLLSVVSGVKLDHRISEFRLVSRKVQRVLNMMPERNLFVRGLLPNMGFPHTVLAYSLGKRHAGKPAYTFRKLLSLAVDAIFAFSILPIRALFVAGLLIARRFLCLRGDRNLQQAVHEQEPAGIHRCRCVGAVSGRAQPRDAGGDRQVHLGHPGAGQTAPGIHHRSAERRPS